MNYVRTLLRVSLIACTWVGCVENFDTTRRPHREATLGENVYEVLCQRLAISEDPHDVSGRASRDLCRGQAAPGLHTPARLKTLHHNRARLVQALDATFGIDSTGTGAVQQDPSLAADMRTLLDQMLPLYDDGLMSRHNQSLVPWMEKLRNTQVTKSLAAQSTRQWYNQTVVQNANREFVVPTAGLPILMRFDQLVELGVAFDKVFGENAPDAPVFEAWLAQVQAALHNYSQKDMSGFLLDYVLHADDALGNEAPPLYSVLRNQHGDAEMLDVRENLKPTIGPTAPFGDANATASTHYTRDEFGRLVEDGAFLYAYQDLNKTPLAAVLRQTQLWMAKLDAQNAMRLSPQLAGLSTDAPPGATILDGMAWLDTVLQSENNASFDTNHLADQSTDSPVLDAAAAADWLSTQEAVKAALPFAQLLWEENEADVAAFIQLFANMSRRMDQSDLVNASLEPGNKFIDDMIDVVQKMAKHPGLLTRVAEAMAKPETSKLGKLLALHMNTSDSIDYDHTDFRSSHPVGEFVTPVDRTKPDVAGNESVFQRLLYLVHDAHNLTIANNDVVFPYATGELFKIDDAALFYLRSIVGKARMSVCSREDEAMFFEAGNARYLGTDFPGMPPPREYGYKYFIEWAMGLSGLTPVPATRAEIRYCNSVRNPENPSEPHRAFSYSVTPQAAARMLFIDPDKLQAWSNAQAQHVSAYGVPFPPCKMYDEPIIGGQGFRKLHGKTLFAWEKHGFHEAIAPLLEAFAEPDPGEEEGNEELFLDLLEVLHKHWSTINSNRTQHQDPNRTGTYADQTGLSQFEPLMGFALHDPNNPNLAMLDLVGNMVRIVLFDEGSNAAEDEYLSPVENATAALFGVQQASASGMERPFVDPNELLGRPNPVVHATDGVSRIAHPAPAHVLNHLAHHLAVQTENFNAQRPGMGSVFGALLDTFSELDSTKTRLANRETHALVTGLLDYLGNNIDKLGHNLRGDADQLLGSPLVATSLDMMNAFNRADPQAGELVQALVTHMVSDEQRPALLNALARTLYTAADAKVDLQPLAEATAAALDYPDGALPMTLKLSSAVNQVDTKAALPRVIANMGRALPNPANPKLMNETPIDVFMDVYQKVNRVNPTDQQSLTADDHSAILGSIAHFVQDAKGGFVRLLEIIRHRHGN